MAEFREVIRQYNRMCEIWRNKEPYCNGCPISSMNNKHDATCTELIRKAPMEFERIVMAWAEEHPEPVYPSWNDAWGRLFPKTYKDKAPCPMHFVGHDRKPEVCAGISCDKCRDRPIPADIAEKLGIKPVEV